VHASTPLLCSPFFKYRASVACEKKEEEAALGVGEKEEEEEEEEEEESS